MHTYPSLNCAGWEREFYLEESTVEGCYPLAVTVICETGQAVRVRGTYVTYRHPVCAGSLWRSAV